MTRRLPQVLALAGLLLSLTASLTASAHEVRPAYLQFTERSDGTFDVLWKQPVLDGRRLPLEPEYPASCQRLAGTRSERTPGALLQRDHLSCDLRSGTLRINGLSQTLTDVLVAIDFKSREDQRFLLKPDQPSQDLSQDTPGIASYLVIGVEHLLFGIDHILFVIALVLYVRERWALLATITAFTVAHSLTLALSVLDLVRVPQAPVEAIIALSILFLARELLLPADRRSPLTARRPWLMAFVFGLLHGLGFAGALADIGLPESQLWLALLLFNVGLELGQLLVVALMLTLGWLGSLLRLRGMAGGTQADGQPTVALMSVQGVMAIGLGAVACYWTFDRILNVL